MKTGLFFGSFNPIHFGHMAIANYVTEFTGIEQIWFIISPQNPFKAKSSLLADYHRYELVNRAISDDHRFKASNVEFKLPKPSYTIDTLTYLAEQYPEQDFYLIIGSDQLPYFHNWKNPDQLIDNYHFLVYPRLGTDKHSLMDNPAFQRIEAPMMEISSTFIRRAIQEKKDMRFFMPEAVWGYIREMHFYE